MNYPSVYKYKALSKFVFKPKWKCDKIVFHFNKDFPREKMLMEPEKTCQYNQSQWWSKGKEDSDDLRCRDNSFNSW